jgi:hypothetical protein
MSMHGNDRAAGSPAALAAYDAYLADVAAGLVDDWDTTDKPRRTTLYIRGRVAATIRRRGHGKWEWDEVLGQRGSDGYLDTFDDALEDALKTLGAGKCTLAQWNQWYRD